MIETEERAMGNSFGHTFRITTWGESHGGGVGVVIDGCPPRLELAEPDIQAELDRRRPGQSRVTTPRQEEDRCEILSGVFEGRTLGTPIAILVRNMDARPAAYADFKEKYRPSHADYIYEAKYGIRNWQGGGETAAEAPQRLPPRYSLGQRLRQLIELMLRGAWLHGYLLA
jgi:chorismate synthase